MDLELENKKVFISGGTSGIGLAAARRFAAFGAKVIINGRSAEKAEKAAASSDERTISYIAGDVSSSSECRRIVNEAYEKMGGIDIVGNSAGIYLEKAILETDETELNRVMSVNFGGTYWISRYALELFRQRNSGAIVNIASDAGIRGNYYCTAYCASKGAVVAYTKSLALEASLYGVRVNCICPGDVMTPMLEKQLENSSDKDKALNEMTLCYPMQRIGSADEIADLICFISSSRASFITGAVIPVDGGLTAC